MNKKIIASFIIIIIIFSITISFALDEIVKHESDIKEGEYEISVFADEKKVLDVYESSSIDGANVGIYERGNQNNQKFIIKANDDGTYILKVKNSNKVLDVNRGNQNVTQYEFHGGDNQKWYFEECEDGCYNIISKSSGLYLDLYKGLAVDGQNIQVYEGHGGKSQKFKLMRSMIEDGEKTIEDGIYNLFSNVTDNRLIEIPDNSIENEAELKLNIKNNLANQKFEIKYNGDGTYTIIALKSEKAIDVKYGSGKIETLVQQYTLHNGIAQRWIIKDNENGTYSFISKCNGLALDVKGGKTEIGASLQMYWYHGQKSQQFIIKKCEDEKGIKSIKDSTYKILSNADKTKAIENLYISKQDDSQIITNDISDSIQQQFDIEYIEDGYYKIISKESNKVLTVESEHPSVGSKIIQKEYNGLNTQKWILKKYSGGIYGIISKCGNLYVSLQSENVNHKERLVLKRGNDLDGQKFIFIDINIGDSATAILRDGTYQIKTVNDKVIDIAGGDYNDGANVHIWSNCKTQNQKFQIEQIGTTGYYQIKAVNSAKALDVQGGNLNLGTNIIQYEYNETDNQQWIISDCGNGYYNIISKKNSLYLDVSGGKTNIDGSNIALWYNNESNAQKFKIEEINIINDNTYEIQSILNSNKILDVNESSVSDGANITLWEAGNSNNQRFYFQAIASDIYIIKAKHSNKVLTVNTYNHNVEQALWNDSDLQKWRIKSAGNGVYYLVNIGTRLTMDLFQGNAVDGGNIQVYNYHGQNSQKFTLFTGYHKFYEEGNYGYSGLCYAGDGRGTKLKYYKIGKGPKVLFMTFSIHGFEDAYSHDGQELTFIAEEFKNYLYYNIPENIVNNWNIYIFPNLNPDGQVYGYTNNGPGRTTLFSEAPLHKGIDMNRNWSVGYSSSTSNARNYNGTAAFQAFEARSLRDFILNHQGNQNFLVDTHGWLNETIGDNELGLYYRNYFGLPTHIASYGNGYLVNWARTLRNGRSTLVELPQVNNHNETISKNYSSKFIGATMQLINEN